MPLFTNDLGLPADPVPNGQHQRYEETVRATKTSYANGHAARVSTWDDLVHGQRSCARRGCRLDRRVMPGMWRHGERLPRRLHTELDDLRAASRATGAILGRACSAFWIRIGGPRIMPRTTLRKSVVVLWQALRYCASRGILPPGGSKPAWLAAPGQSRGAYSIERNGQSRSSQARTAW